jgi:LacI family transcriptional regulator
MMPVTIKDVAKLSQVSTATVSRVINDEPRVSKKTKEKVLNTIHQLDYKVNKIARSLKTNKTYTIGFICPELANSFFMTVAKGVEDELRKQGYSVIICNSNDSAGEEKERIKLLLEKCVDGVIIIPATSEGAHYNRLKDQGVPVVLVDRLVENFVADAVLVDNTNGSYAAVEFLINQGHQRIGYIGGDIRITSARERDAGYKRALEDYCIPVDPEIVKYGDFHVESGYQKMKELMETINPPGFVFISNYYMHVGATKYLIENKNALKKSVLIASFDDMDLSAILGFCNVRVGQPMSEIGNKAAQMLLSRIHLEKQSFPQVVRLKTNLIFK